MVENAAGIFRLPIRREAHELVLAGIDLEAGVVGEGGIEQPERVRKMDLRKHLEVMPAAERRRSGRPLAHAIHGQHQGLLER